MSRPGEGKEAPRGRTKRAVVSGLAVMLTAVAIVAYFGLRDQFRSSIPIRVTNRTAERLEDVRLNYAGRQVRIASLGAGASFEGAVTPAAAAADAALSFRDARGRDRRMELGPTFNQDEPVDTRSRGPILVEITGDASQMVVEFRRRSLFSDSAVSRAAD